MTDETLRAVIWDWARAAALVVLTRRDDLTIEDAGTDPGPEFRVFVDQPGEAIRPSFHVIARATTSTITTDQANEFARSTVAENRGARDVAAPLCLLYLSMRGGEEFFAWIDEPTQIDGVTKLVRHPAPDSLPVTRDLLNHVVESVVAWWACAEALI